MLGQELADPGGIERQGCMQGLGLLGIRTTMQAEKVTRLCSGMIRGGVLFGQPIRSGRISGYEIHVGQTDYLPQAEPFATLNSGELDGCISVDGRILGTYVHGIFDEDEFRHQFVIAARSFYQLALPSVLNPWNLQRKESLDRLAHHVSESLDMDRIFAWAGLSYRALPLLVGR